MREFICVALGVTVGILLLTGNFLNISLAFAMFLMGLFVAFH